MSCAYLLKTKNNLVESFRPVKVLGIGTINNQPQYLSALAFFALLLSAAADWQGLVDCQCCGSALKPAGFC
jgi:hypothetical protein